MTRSITILIIERKKLFRMFRANVFVDLFFFVAKLIFTMNWTSQSINNNM